MSAQAPTPAKKRWYKQIGETYRFTSEHVSKLALKLLVTFVVVLSAFIAFGFFTDAIILFSVFGVTTAILTTLVRFGRIAEKAAYASIDGQPGAAAAVLQNMRGAWFTAPGVGVDRTQNLVHRVAGRPGIILVAEGERPGVLLAEQKKAHSRYVPGVPIHEIVVDGTTVTLANLQKTIKKLDKALRPAEVTDLRRRLDALPKNAIPIPKGPIPQGRKIARR